MTDNEKGGGKVQKRFYIRRTTSSGADGLKFNVGRGEECHED